MYWPAWGPTPVQPALRMGTDGRFHRILLRPSLPFGRGLEERPAARPRRINRRILCAVRVDHAHQDQGGSRKLGPGGFLTRHVAALSGAGASLGGTVLRGRTLLSLFRPASDAERMGQQTPAGGQRSYGRVPA